MTRKGESITLSISERDKAQLEEIAFELNFKWGPDRPNISKFVEAIARKQVQVGLNNDWSSDRINTLNAIRKKLIDLGEIQQAQELAVILSERSELPRPLRKEIEKFLEETPKPWRTDIEKFIRKHQPFRLNYQDAVEHPYSFSIHHASIELQEKREYLLCWCEETLDNNDIPELKHNRTLRLDRIPAEAVITSIKAKWRPKLDLIKVEFYLTGNLAFAYQSRPQDEEVNWLSGRSQPTLQVIRKISNTFWFFREILPYAENCEIIAPDKIRQKFIEEKLFPLWTKYKVNAIGHF